MCGIAGVILNNEGDNINLTWLDKACFALSKRGPDNQGRWMDGPIGLAHARLSILDVSAIANQPFTDPSGRYIIVFNGEIFNFKSLRHQLEQDGLLFRSNGDTEVLLQLYIRYGASCLDKLVGFFAFAIYDQVEKILFAARDRFGIKPFYYAKTDKLFCFGSEMKAITAFPIPREIDFTALSVYFQLNYIPGPLTIYKHVKKLLPGHYLIHKEGEIHIHRYYEVSVEKGRHTLLSYEQQKAKLQELLEEAVQLRLISDVPLGTFLSGGIDSSVITGLASRHTSHLNTFSIGFKDASFYDETEYAQLVARHFNTHHTVFKLSNDDLHESLRSLLAYVDEPFADSSALLVNLLSKFTRRKVTVALSGDGGDELFGGYNKHGAEWLVRNGGWKMNAVNFLAPLWDTLPKSRQSKTGNLIRQLDRFAKGSEMPDQDRYWRWCSITPEKDITSLLINSDITSARYQEYKQCYTSKIEGGKDLNDLLLSDVNLVLPNDMLTKVDLMSMANSLEVRVPFLDHRVVEFAFSIPSSSKVDGRMKKKIVQDTFRDMLPGELYNRPKKGFEVPLLHWFRTDLKSKILDDLLAEGFIQEQGIFKPEGIRTLKEKLFSSDPGDIQAQIWALLVFQYWYKNFHLDNV